MLRFPPLFCVYVVYFAEYEIKWSVFLRHPVFVCFCYCEILLKCMQTSGISIASASLRETLPMHARRLLYGPIDRQTWTLSLLFCSLDIRLRSVDTSNLARAL